MKAVRLEEDAVLGPVKTFELGGGVSITVAKVLPNVDKCGNIS